MTTSLSLADFHISHHTSTLQITKHIAKIDGVEVFTGLLTVTNEWGEIRVINLVATKSHNQFESALSEMKISLEMYGHGQPAIFYTDNPAADKAFLERAFPSLLLDVIEKDPYKDLLPLTLEGITVRTTSNSADITRICRAIVDSVESGDDLATTAVGFDMEWPVYSDSQTGRITGAGKTALVQIAHEDMVHLFQVRYNCLCSNAAYGPPSDARFCVGFRIHGKRDLTCRTARALDPSLGAQSWKAGRGGPRKATT